MKDIKSELIGTYDNLSCLFIHLFLSPDIAPTDLYEISGAQLAINWVISFLEGETVEPLTDHWKGVH